MPLPVLSKLGLRAPDSFRLRFVSRLWEDNMCEIGKPLEIVDVEPLSLPKPLRREQGQPAEQPELPVTIEIPVAETGTVELG